jgi:hypothetical protein
MKRKGWIVIAVIIMIAAGIVWYKHAQWEAARQGIGSAAEQSDEETQTQKAPLFASDRTYCFEYLHEATADAPYRVEEKLTLTKARQSITGEKRGTQAGPGMTNGYEGTIVGSIAQNSNGYHIEGDFTYTVEGATQTEHEIYETFGDTLVKLRYELTDVHGTLTPDTNSTPTRLTYSPVAC